MRFFKHLGALALIAGLALSPARASVVWTESNAGELPGSAELTGSPLGAGPLTQILGHLDFDNNAQRWDIDLYAIGITNLGLFSAHTESGVSNVADPALFLFGADGRGVYLNDDTTNIDLQSTIPAVSALGPLGSGLYYLGVAWAFSDPQSASGAIFPLYEQFLDTVGVYGPSGSGGADPLIAWLSGGPPNFDVPSDYSIILTGAAPAVIPEPGTLALLALGFLIVAARVRPGRA